MIAAEAIATGARPPDDRACVGDLRSRFARRSSAHPRSPPWQRALRPHMSDAVRADPQNMIWLCRNCHLLTDDATLYTVELLEQWRHASCEYARLLQGTLQTTTVVLDCPWCKRLIPVSATHCAYRRDVVRSPVDLVASAFMLSSFATSLLLMFLLYLESSLTWTTGWICLLVAPLLVVPVLRPHTERVRAHAATLGERFVRTTYAPQRATWNALRETRYAHPRTISTIELARNGINVTSEMIDRSLSKRLRDSQTAMCGP